MITTEATKLDNNNMNSAHAERPNRGIVINIIAIAVLTALVLLCFGRTLESFFLADDFGEVSYVAKIFAGAKDLYWSNFTGNYMQIPSMAVWRPWLITTLVFDYAIWKTNAFGYYLTNLVYFIGDVILLYALISKLTNSWSSWRSKATAFFTAALFATSPLHCESISWVVGRVDVACCFYYLLGFYLMLVKGRMEKLSVALATASFWLALWTKEMAIGLPVMVTVAHALLPSDGLGFAARFKKAFVKASPLWLSTLIYFPLRYMFLGTLTGGYTGSIGASQFSGLLARWLDVDTLHRIAHPLNYSLFQNTSIFSSILTGCYLIALAIIGTRLLNRQLSLKWLLFIGAWLATCAVPIYQLWGLGYDLEGSRFYFFLTLPLSFLLPALLFQPVNSNADGHSGGNSNGKYWPVILSVAILSVLVFAYGKVAYLTNMTWVHAGKEVRAVFEQSKKIAEASTGPFIVLGIPKRQSGAHMILNGDTYRMMLSPPFTQDFVADRFITFDPILFGPAEFIDTSRFKNTLKANITPFVWSSDKKQFEKLSFNQSVKNVGALALGKGICVTNAQAGDALKFTGLNINPLSYDYLAFDVSASNCPLTFTATWNGGALSGNQASITTKPNRESKTVYLPLSHYWRWFTVGTIADLALSLPPTKELTISNVRLMQQADATPKLTVNANLGNTGIYSPPPGKPVEFTVNKPIAEAAVEIQISKPNFFFNNFADANEAIGSRLYLSPNQTQFVLPESTFKTAGYYQIRAVLKDGNRELGSVSEALTLQK